MAPVRRSRKTAAPKPARRAAKSSPTPRVELRPAAGRVVKVEAERFVSGARRLGVLAAIEPDPEPGTLAGETPIAVDVVRSRDLLVCRVEAYGCDLHGGSRPVLRPRSGATARLVVRFGYQHLGEEATYEGGALPVPTDNPTKVQTVPGPAHLAHDPVRARPSRASRIVLDVPEGEEIGFTSEGLLEALGRLPLLVHPLAKPGTAIIAAPGVLGGTARSVLHLPDGLIGVVSEAGLVVSPGRKADLIDATTVAGLVSQQRDLRFARTMLATEAGVAERVGPAALAAPSDLTIELGDRQVQVPRLFGAAEGGGLVIRPPRNLPPFRRPTFSRPAQADETAIEAPYRLVISPDAGAGWAHADRPVEADDNPDRVELWHTRLGRRPVDDAGTIVEGPTDERSTPTRIIRAVWARDRERYPDPLHPPLGSDLPLQHDDRPFRMSLDGKDRHMLVRQSAETWPDRTKLIAPSPVAARSLWLSSLGAWLDLHGAWNTKPYSDAQPAGISAILSWDHIAPLGRDQYVRVVYPGYLYPFGHKAALVKLTERKMKDASPSVAALYQRKFIVVGEPVKRFDQRDLPFREVRLEPTVTPTLFPDPGPAQDSYFWPMVDGQKFRWVWHCLDAEMRPVRLVAPLVWVAEAFGQNQAEFTQIDTLYGNDADSTVASGGQKIAFAEVRKGGDTVAEAVEVSLRGKAVRGGSTPRLEDAKVTLPAVQQLAKTGPLTIEYADVFKTNGFGGAANSGEIWAKVKGTLPKLEFGGGSAPAGSDKAGGFLTPTLPIEGLSRLSGTVGDITGMATQDFKPDQFLKDSLPKLFGIIPLLDLVEAVTGDLLKVPNVVSEALDRVEAFLADLAKAKQAALQALAEAQAQVDRTVGRADLNAAANAALGDATALEAQVRGAVDDVVSTVASLVHKTEGEIDAAMTAPLDALRDAVVQIEAVAPQLTPLVRNELLGLAKVLHEVLDAVDLISDMFRMLNGLASSSVQARFHFEWRPNVAPWPSATDPIFAPKDREHCLILSVDGRASGKGEMGAEVLAELRDFTLILLPGVPLVEIDFDHLSFHAGSSGKADVDVVIKRFEFVGILGFVEALRDLIPFDGFSDPPFLDVSAKGLSAGFTLALPNVAVGVFALSNISLGADLQVPFLGGELSVGFNFCSRERPFTLAVTFIGGGGWFLLRISPKGLDVLEVGLEAGATLSVDLVVASGSVSAMVGVYLRLEGQGGSLTAYFRLRGEVNVLGLISASIELYLELHYVFDTGKLVGKATLTIEIDIFFISIPVKITCERQFAGSKGDPSFRQMMAVTGGVSDPWDEYCLAFVGA